MWIKKNTPLAVICFFLLQSCGSENAPTLSPSEKILYDSLHKVEFNNIRAESDSLCKMMEDSLFNYYVDSLITIRLQEVETLIKDQ